MMYLVPIALQPKGQSKERKMYLFNELREFVAEWYRDLVCPNPATQYSVQTDENNNAVYTEGAPGGF